MRISLNMYFKNCCTVNMCQHMQEVPTDKDRVWKIIVLRSIKKYQCQRTRAGNLLIRSSLIRSLAHFAQIK